MTDPKKSSKDRMCDLVLMARGVLGSETFPDDLSNVPVKTLLSLGRALLRRGNHRWEVQNPIRHYYRKNHRKYHRKRAVLETAVAKAWRRMCSEDPDYVERVLNNRRRSVGGHTIFPEEE